jgi:hypothetical protein
MKMRFGPNRYALKALGVALAGLVSTGAFAGQGNGLPNVPMTGAFNLNIHATDKCPSAAYDGSNRHTIVVQSTNVTLANQQHNAGHADSSALNDIELRASDSDDFVVLDGNACDNDPAALELPALVATNYDVYLKFIGKPGTKLDPVLCAVDVADVTTVWCHTGTTITTRTTGQGATQFKNYTKQLFGVQDILDICSGNVCDLFDTAIEGFFWDWSASTGAKAILRFVPCADQKTGPDPSLVDCAGNTL